MNPVFFDEIRTFLVLLTTDFPVKGKRHSITVNEEGHLQVTVWYADGDTVLHQHSFTLEEDDYFKSRDEVLEEVAKYIEDLKNPS